MPAAPLTAKPLECTAGRWAVAAAEKRVSNPVRTVEGAEWGGVGNPEARAAVMAYCTGRGATASRLSIHTIAAERPPAGWSCSNVKSQSKASDSQAIQLTSLYTAGGYA